MNVCESCVLRLFNPDHYNMSGTGNPYSGLCIIVPSVDNQAYKKGDFAYSTQVKIIKDVLSSTGEVDVFIVPLVRCKDAEGHHAANLVYGRCMKYFAMDLQNWQFRHILVLGDAAQHLLHWEVTPNLNYVSISKNQRTYAVNYAPLVKTTDKAKFEVFKHYLLKWYRCAKSNDFTPYNFRML